MDRVVFNVDSTYAIKMAKREWRPKRANARLANRLASAYARLCKARPSGGVVINHVRSHKGELGNEIADRMAKRGAESGAGHQHDGAYARHVRLHLAASAPPPSAPNPSTPQPRITPHSTSTSWPRTGIG